MIRSFLAAGLLLANTVAQAETVAVKYRGPVNLAPFACTDITRSSFIDRVCYDKTQTYMVIQLKGTYYQYCEIPGPVVERLLNAPSMGQFYNANLKGSGSDGPYDCRTHRAPAY